MLFFRISRKQLSKTAALFTAFIMLLTLFFTFTVRAEEVSGGQTAPRPRPSVNGALHVEGRKLKDSAGNVAALKGVSSHGLTWFPDFINEPLFRQLASDWDADLVRLAVYSEEYSNGQKDTCLDLVRKGIDYAVASDMYVIVDWHVLEEHDPNVHADQAEDFFTIICQEYKDTPNIIFEICNEPNGETSWSDVTAYANRIIPLIRSYCPDSVILVGTPNYDRDLVSVTRDPLEFDNIMYVLHFYAGTHKSDLRRELMSAVHTGLPVFISECGISESTGNGVVDYDSAEDWFTYLDSEDISFAVWSLSNKNESSAFFKPTYDPANPVTDESLTPSGTWIRELIRGVPPISIPVPDGASTRELSPLHKWLYSLDFSDLANGKAWPIMAAESFAAILICGLLLMIFKFYTRKKYKTYDDIHRKDKAAPDKEEKLTAAGRAVLLFFSIFFTVMYLYWRVHFSIPFDDGWIAVTGNIILLVVEILGFIESLILYNNLSTMKDHPLPRISEDEYPDVDIFISTYNEPTDLLRRTVNGCTHMIYPDKSKVHIWLCDDNRRPAMRKLAEEMNVGYFDRPNNEGAKAGNLNNALSKTSSPYVVTFDADMIPRSNFLMKTIPYFVDAKKRSEGLPEKDKIRLGLLQTPQCFYDPDVFQHALYSEKSAPNEQDFFYRTIEVSKTSTNSVIYGGSNTIISREALEAIGGFYTKSITEDFATGMLIESAGFVSLATPEPLASGKTPHTYKEHIQQRARWGRGVISTGKQLKLLSRKGLSLEQKLSYWSSVIYWYSPIKNLIYLISPFMFSVFAVPVFKCSWFDLIVFWLPMFIVQDLCLKVFSKKAISIKWSGIYEMSVMPRLLIPVIKETLGITYSKFEVTDKTARQGKRQKDWRSLRPFIILIILSVFGIIRSIYVLTQIRTPGIFILLFWLFRNLYFLVMSVFLIDGRDSDSEPVNVRDAEMITLKKNSAESGDMTFYGVTTNMNEHCMKLYLDESEGLNIGDIVEINIERDSYSADMTGIVIGKMLPRVGGVCVCTVEITDPRDDLYVYWQILYDRIPTLPQSLQRDMGIIPHMMMNLGHRLLTSE